jgi:hypothetical protein
MSDIDPSDFQAALSNIRDQISTQHIRIAQHAHQEMVEEDISLDDVLEAGATGQIIENYPEHRRGACCLLSGITKEGRPLHIVCTTTLSVLIVITVYEPKPPKWLTPSQRSR